MTPGARIQTSIELLDTIIAAARIQGAPADRVLANWFRNNRFAGSKDRRAIRDLVYRAIRACGPLPRTGRGAMLRLAQVDPELVPQFDGSKYGAPRIGKSEIPARGGIAPDSLMKVLAESGIDEEEAAALLNRAPLDLRVNTLKTDRKSIALPEAAQDLPIDQGLRLPFGTQVEQWDNFKNGEIEVQDCGSQVSCLAVGAQAGEVVIDLCAGAGGKTLSLAAQMGNSGTLIASDTDRGRLSRLEPRAARAGANVTHTVLLNPKAERDALKQWLGKADRVLVDAPCSGTGTWRRNPEARWRLNNDVLERYTDTQAYLLDLAADLLREGGTLTYVVCSLLDEEGSAQFARFLECQPDFENDKLTLPMGSEHGPGVRLTPHSDGTDGFFIARARKT